MLKLTRLNKQTVAINPDHVMLVDVNPDTTLKLINGEKIIVRESLEQLIDAYVALRRRIHTMPAGFCGLGRTEGTRPPLFELSEDEEEDD